VTRAVAVATPRWEGAMSDKSPRQTPSKKSGQTLKQKRAVKKAKKTGE